MGPVGPTVLLSFYVVLLISNTNSVLFFGPHCLTFFFLLNKKLLFSSLGFSLHMLLSFKFYKTNLKRKCDNILQILKK